jgi:hypothetical protein
MTLRSRKVSPLACKGVQQDLAYRASPGESRTTRDPETGLQDWIQPRLEPTNLTEPLWQLNEVLHMLQHVLQAHSRLLDWSSG